jgi:hypothetical protein
MLRHPTANNRPGMSKVYRLTLQIPAWITVNPIGLVERSISGSSNPIGATTITTITIWCPDHVVGSGSDVLSGMYPPLRHGLSSATAARGRHGLPSGSTMLRLGAVGLTGGLPGGFAGAFGAYLRPHDGAAVDGLAGLGAHSRALQRALRPRAMPLGFEVRNGRAALQVRSMCNLYSISTNQVAIRHWLNSG